METDSTFAGHGCDGLGCCLQTSNTTLLKSYYMQAYSTVRKYSNCFVALCPPESQVDGSEFQSFMAASPYTKVIQDVHRCGSVHGCLRCLVAVTSYLDEVT